MSVLKKITKLWVCSLMLLPLYGYADWQKPEGLEEYALQVELAEQADGSLIAFYIDMGKEIHYMKETAPGSNAWSKAKSMDTYANSIAIGHMADGRLVVFNIGTLGNVVYAITQSAVNSDDWGKEKELEDLYGTQLKAVSDGNGDVNLFVLQMDREVGHVKHTAQGWSKKKNMDIYANQIEVASHADGRLVLFNVGTVGNVLYHSSQKAVGGHEWHKEKEFKGVYGYNLKATMQQDGKVALYFIDMGSEVTVIKQNAPNSEAWSKGKTLGINANQIDVVTNTDGITTIFAIATMANALSYTQQTAANSDDWNKEKYFDGYGKQLSAGVNSNGKAHLFYIAALANEVYSVGQK